MWKYIKLSELVKNLLNIRIFDFFFLNDTYHHVNAKAVNFTGHGLNCFLTLGHNYLFRRTATWLVDWVLSSRSEEGNICKQQGSCIPARTYFKQPGQPACSQSGEIKPGHLRRRREA